MMWKLFTACLLSLLEFQMTNAISAGGITFDDNFSDAFTVDIEYSLLDENYMEYIYATYDRNAGKIRLVIESAFQRNMDIIFDFNSKQKITYDHTSSGEPSCEVKSLDNDDADLFFVGGMNVDGSINSPFAFFHMDGISADGYPIRLTGQGEGKERGFGTMKYTSTQVWRFPDKDYREKVDLTIDISNEKWERVERGLIPVKLVASIYNTENQRTLNYFNYRSFVEEDAFHLKAGVVCKGLKNQKPFPLLAPYLSYGEETMFPTELVQQQVIFDTLHKFVRIQYMGNVTKHQAYIEFKDYTTGLAHIMDVQTLLCTTENISTSGRSEFDYVGDDGKFHQKTPEGFFDDPKNTNYYYIGDQTIRGIVTEAWVAEFPSDPIPKVVQWHFAKNTLKTWNDGTDLEKDHKLALPVAKRIRMHNVPELVSYFYDVQFGDPNFNLINLDSCFPGENLGVVTITVPMSADEQKSITKDINKFKWATAKQIAAQTGIGIIRVNGLQPILFEDSVTIKFDIVENPYFSKDIDASSNKHKSLQEDLKSIADAIDAGNFFIKGADGKQFKVTSHNIIQGTKAGTFQRVYGSNKVQGYSAGSMAGLGIAMIIIGAAVGLALAYFVIVPRMY